MEQEGVAAVIQIVQGKKRIMGDDERRQVHLIVSYMTVNKDK